MKEIMTPEEAAQLVQQSNLISRAWVADQIAQRPFAIQIQTLDLTTARLETDPYPIRGQFKSMYIEAATDVNTYINVKLGSRDTTQSAFKMYDNDSISMDYPINEAFLHWPAQSGKSITFITFTSVEFKTGSQVSVSGGGVSVSEGTSIGAAARTTLVAATAAIIAPSNTSRKVGLVQNNTGADIWIAGTSAVTNTGASRGIKMADGVVYELKNTGALYGYSVAGGDVTLVELT